MSRAGSCGKMSNFRYEISFTNFGYTKHADNYPDAVKIAKESGFDCVVRKVSDFSGFRKTVGKNNAISGYSEIR